MRTVSFEAALTVVGIDSNYEPLTDAAFQYREQNVYPHLESQGLRIDKYQGRMARRIYVSDAVREPGVRYVTGVGHGFHTTYTGDFGDLIFQVGEYAPEEVKDKIIHFLSCQTAAKLGPDMVRNGCKAYFGYDKDFTFLTEQSSEFFQCDSEIDKAFADGLSADEVYHRAFALFSEKIEQFLTEGNRRGAAVLEFDRDHLCAPSVNARWGDLNARLY